MPVKFLSFTDVHISDVNPRSRTGDYRQDIFDKLIQIRDAGKKLGVDFFLCGGDLYNLKAPMRNSHLLNNMLISLFKSFPAPIYSTEGNHDLHNDCYEYFDEQPMSVLYSAGAMYQLRDSLLDINGIKVRLRGFPFDENPDLDSYKKAKDDVDFNICALHLYSSLSGGLLFKQKIYPYNEIALLNDDIFVMGHYHIDQGVHLFKDYGKDQYFINLGAVSRGSLSEDNIERTPRISFVTLDKIAGVKTIKAIPAKLKVRPFNEVFNLEEKKENKEKLKAAEEYVASLKQEISVEDNGEDKIKNEINSLNLEQLVLNKIEHYLDEADLEIKDML